MSPAERDQFDAMLERILESLPRRIHDLLDEAPLIVEDRPAPELLEELGIDPGDDLLCGLHTGVALTERSIEDAAMPDVIQLFREGIVEHAGGWERWQDDEGQRWGGADAIEREIRITLLHEIGHHFGLDEDDLAELGYE